MVQFCKKVSESKWFQNTITLAIIIAGILVGIATYTDFSEKYEFILEIANKIILWIFVAEVVVKIIAEGKKPWRYFYDGWNIFDFIIVAAAFMPFGGSSVAILRLLRLLRVLKLVKALPKLQLLVNALLKSIPSMGYVSVLLLLLFYIYAVAAVFFFGANDPIHFENLQMSMLSLFRVVTLEDWTDVMYINMYGCENYGYDGNMGLCTNSSASPVGAAIFFVSFVLLGTMIILNLFIGVIMNGMDEAKTELSILENSEASENEDHLIVLEKKLSEIQSIIENLKQQSDTHKK